MSVRIDGQSQVPEVRRRLMEITDLMVLEGPPEYRRYVKMIRDVVPLLNRQKAVRRAKKTRKDPGPEKRKAIRAYTKQHPEENYDSIGRRFNVTGGRVSEAMREAEQ